VATGNPPMGQSGALDLERRLACRGVHKYDPAANDGFERASEFVRPTT
jgi:hypothetical protein